jgi:hypothetical protein
LCFSSLIEVIMPCSQVLTTFARELDDAIATRTSMAVKEGTSPHAAQLREQARGLESARRMLARVSAEHPATPQGHDLTIRHLLRKARAVNAWLETHVPPVLSDGEVRAKLLLQRELLEALWALRPTASGDDSARESAS